MEIATHVRLVRRLLQEAGHGPKGYRKGHGSGQKGVDDRPRQPQRAVFGRTLHLDLKHYDEARAYAERDIKLHKTDYTLYLAMADIETHTGSRAKGVAALQSGLEATKRHPELLWNLANAYLDSGDTSDRSKAQAIIQEMQTMPFSSKSVRLQYLNARVEYAKSIGRRPSRPWRRCAGLANRPQDQKWVDYWIGQCYGQAGNSDKQLASYRKAVAVDPSFVTAHAALAQNSYGDWPRRTRPPRSGIRYCARAARTSACSRGWNWSARW